MILIQSTGIVDNISTIDGMKNFNNNKAFSQCQKMPARQIFFEGKLSNRKRKVSYEGINWWILTQIVYGN